MATQIHTHSRHLKANKRLGYAFKAPFAGNLGLGVDLSRRAFLGALAWTPLGRVRGGRTRRAAPCLTCALPESRAGFERALAGRDTTGVLVLPGAAGWDASLASRVRGGQLVILESAAGFAGTREFEEQQAGLRADFDLATEQPVSLWNAAGRPPYLHLEWPLGAQVRDFSFAVPVRGGETIGVLGGLSVAARRRAGAGALLFLGSPVGPALGTGDPQAHAWLWAVLATARGPW